MTIHDHVAELSAAVAALQTKVTTLQTEVTTLRASRRRSRLRALVPILTLLCVMGLSLALMPITRAQSPETEESQPSDQQPAPAEPDTAASPNDTDAPLVIGRVNQPTSFNDTTTLRDPSGTELMQTTLRVDNYSTTSLFSGLVTNRRVAIVGSVSGVDTTSNYRIGVLGASDTGAGVYGHSLGASGTGVIGTAPGAYGAGVTGSGGKYGGMFIGTSAAIHLDPAATAGAPTTGSHSMGELVVSSDGHLWFCRAGGTPGQWVRLDLDSTFVPLIQK